MLDMLRMLLCGLGVVYFVVRVGSLASSLVRGLHPAIRADALADNPDRPGASARMNRPDTVVCVREQPALSSNRFPR
jgi:hypothetical protein